MSNVLVSIYHGYIEVDSRSLVSAHASDDDVIQALAEAFKAAGSPDEVLCSSSVDFPEEDEGAAGRDYRWLISSAIDVARAK